MARTARPKDFSDIQELAEELIAVIEDITLQYSQIPNVTDELSVCRQYAEIISNKAPRIQRLTTMVDRMPVMITPDGSVAELSEDEARRIIMQYPPRRVSVLEMLKHWKFVDGKWIEEAHDDER